MGVIAEDAIGSIWRFVTRANDSNGVVVAAIAVVIAALAQMIFGELAPKNLAISRPMGVALGLAPILRLYGLVGSPLKPILRRSRIFSPGFARGNFI
jgi:CBS domain containing-hemolysin-like protein